MHKVLYDKLGVSPAASKEQIKKAYRKKAKKLHPDQGGSPDDFTAVNRAYMVLINDESRKKYDATGDETLKSADNERSRIMQVIAGTLEQVIAMLESQRKEPSEHDLVLEMRGKITNELVKREQHIQACHVLISKTEKLIGKFTVKKGNNFIEQMLMSKIDNIELNIETSKMEIEPLQAALDMLKEVKFAMDIRKTSQTGYQTIPSSLMEALTRGV